MKPCEDCGGNGVVPWRDMRQVPCGWCAACQRFDFGGCMNPADEEVEDCGRTAKAHCRTSEAVMGASLASVIQSRHHQQLEGSPVVSIWKHATVLGKIFVVIVVGCFVVAVILVANSLMGPA